MLPRQRNLEGGLLERLTMAIERVTVDVDRARTGLAPQPAGIHSERALHLSPRQNIAVEGFRGPSEHVCRLRIQSVYKKSPTRLGHYVDRIFGLVQCSWCGGSCAPATYLLRGECVECGAGGDRAHKRAWYCEACGLGFVPRAGD